jgi:transposase
MSYIVKQKIKGQIYLYRTISYWDKDKKQPRQKREYIGKQDAKTNQISKPRHLYTVKEYGPLYFLKEIEKKLGIKRILENHFHGLATVLLYLAYFKLCEAKPLYLFESWLESAYHEEEVELSSQSISRLLKVLNDCEEQIFAFVKEWISKVQPKNEFIIFDITSFSTYSQSIDFSEWGYNRDKESLAQINLGVVFGEPTGLPLYYSVYPGSIQDVKTIRNIVEELDELSLKNTLFILDKGFFSSYNLSSMHDMQYIIPFITRNKQSKELIKKHCQSINSVENIIKLQDKIYYSIHEKIKLEDNPYSAYLYLDERKRVEEKELFIKSLMEIEEHVKSFSFNSEEKIEQFFLGSKKEYRKYFDIVKSDRKYIILRINEKIERKIKTFGMFILLSHSSNLTAKQVLELYRRRDSVEKFFDTMKNEINQKRLHIHSQEALEGLLFIDFISLIFYSYMIKVFKEKELNKNYSIPEVMFELRKIRKVFFGEKKSVITEVSKTQREIFSAFNISAPGPMQEETMR